MNRIRSLPPASRQAMLRDFAAVFVPGEIVIGGGKSSTIVFPLPIELFEGMAELGKRAVARAT